MNKYLDKAGLATVFKIIGERDKIVEQTLTEMLNEMSQKIVDLENLIYTYHPKEEEPPVVEPPVSGTTILINGEDYTDSQYEIEEPEEIIFTVNSDTELEDLDLYSSVQIDELSLYMWSFVAYPETLPDWVKYSDVCDGYGQHLTHYTVKLSKENMETIKSSLEKQGLSEVTLTLKVNDSTPTAKVLMKLSVPETPETPDIADDKKLEIVGNGAVRIDSQDYSNGTYETTGNASQIIVYDGSYDKLHLPNCNGSIEFRNIQMMSELRVGTGVIDITTNKYFLPYLIKCTLDGTTFNLTSTTNITNNESVTLTISDVLQEVKANNLTFNGKGGGMIGRVNQIVDVSFITDFDTLLPFINAEVTKETTVNSMSLKVNASLYNQAVEANISNGGKWTYIESA